MEKLDINGAILEVISLIHSELIKNGVTAGTELAEPCHAFKEIGSNSNK